MTLELKIEYDECSTMNPRTEWDNVGTMVCFHKRYNLGDETDLREDWFNGWDEVEKHLIEEEGAAVIIPLYLYDHGALSISTSGFSSSWDSGQIGFIYATREEILKEWPGSRLTEKKKKLATNVLENEVKVYDQFVRGEVYMYKVMDDNDCLECCAGFFDREYAEAEGQAALEACIEEKQEKQEKFDAAMTIAREKLSESTLRDLGL